MTHITHAAVFNKLLRKPAFYNLSMKWKVHLFIWKMSEKSLNVATNLAAVAPRIISLQTQEMHNLFI